MHIDEETAENARVRDFTLQAFKRMGYEGPIRTPTVSSST